RLHELFIFFSVLGGLQVFGVLGLVIGPVVVAITLALLDVLRNADRPAAETLAEPTLAEQQAALRDVPPDEGGTPDALVGNVPVTETPARNVVVVVDEPRATARPHFQD